MIDLGTISDLCAEIIRWRRESEKQSMPAQDKFHHKWPTWKANIKKFIFGTALLRFFSLPLKKPNQNTQGKQRLLAMEASMRDKGVHIFSSEPGTEA